eukprot:scaffold2462_cov402-Prasinococcus_capsulatus_cf.AAC.12
MMLMVSCPPARYPQSATPNLNDASQTRAKQQQAHCAVRQLGACAAPRWRCRHMPPGSRSCYGCCRSGRLSSSQVRLLQGHPRLILRVDKASAPGGVKLNRTPPH